VPKLNSALDWALNREIEMQMRKQLSEEFERKESDLRQQLTKEAAERTERNSAVRSMAAISWNSGAPALIVERFRRYQDVPRAAGLCHDHSESS